MRTRDKSINIRVTGGEKKRLETKVKKYGMTVSTYLRIQVLIKILSRSRAKIFIRLTEIYLQSTRQDLIFTLRISRRKS